MNTAIIGIGSNIEAEANIPKMLTLLQEEVKIIKVSAMVKTKPIGMEDQPDFTNGAVKIETGKSHNGLKQYLKTVEDKLGRDRAAPKSGPRTMDLDIVIWNGKIIDQDYFTREFLRKSIEEIK